MDEYPDDWPVSACRKADELDEECEALRKRVAELESERSAEFRKVPGRAVDAFERGYAACEADVVAHYRRRLVVDMTSEVIAKAIEAGMHRGAAARKGGG